MGVHKGQCPRITGRKQCRGTLFPASITGKKECRGKLTLFLASNYREEESAGVHSFLPVNKQAENSGVGNEEAPGAGAPPPPPLVSSVSPYSQISKTWEVLSAQYCYNTDFLPGLII